MRRAAGVNLPELIGGLAVAGLGSFAVWEASGYPIGELTRMGPGYFPLVLGVILVVLGLGIVWEGRRLETERPKPRLRAVCAVSSGMLAFGLLADRAGVVPATVALVLIASLADRRPRLVTTLAVALALAAFGYVVFIRALGLPMRAFG